MNYKFRIKEACRIAGVDRDRFNEAVHAGNYKCAPDVVRGSSRVFDEVDLIVLFIYGQFLKDSFSPSLAGRLACHICERLKADTEGRQDAPDQVLLARTSRGNYVVQSGHGDIETPRWVTHAHVFWTLSFDIRNIRETIQREIREELSIIGSDDE